MKTFDLNQGVHLHIIESKKFKDVSIYFNYYNKLTSQNRVTSAFLSKLIGDKTVKYPTKMDMLRQFDNLYGANHNVTNTFNGSASILQVNLKVLNSVYTEKSVLLDSFKLIKEMIEHSIINQETFEEARKNLIDASNRKMEKPTTYAISCANTIYGKDSYLALNSILPIEDIKACTIEQVISAHKDIIDNSRLDIFVFGDVNCDEINEIVNQVFTFNNREDQTHIPQQILGPSFEEFTEYRDIDQCNIVMMYKTNVASNSDDFYILRLANCIFGSFPTSLLFQEVREKNSLCYSIGSSLASEEGALMVRTGIDQENQEKTIDLINQQFKRMQAGDYDDEILQNAITLFTNLMYGSIDDQAFTLNLMYNNLITNQDVTIEKICERCQKVTKEDIQRVFKNMELKLVYTLKKQVIENE